MAKPGKKAKPRNITVSLEMGDEFIKLCEVAFFKQKEVVRLADKKILSKSDSDISREITGLFSALNIPKQKTLLNIPRHLVITRTLCLPSTNDDEIKRMVAIEAAKQTPYRDEDMVLGFRVLEKLKNGYSDILFAIAQKPMIDRFINIFKNADLTIEKIALGSEALLGWYASVKKKEEPSVKSVALINACSEYVDIDIIENGKLIFTRAFSPRRLMLSPDRRALVEEIKKSIAAYSKMRNLGIDRAYLSGADNMVRDIEPILKEEGVPLEIIAQNKNMELDRTAGPNLGEASFVELIGLSLKDKDMKINLLPEKMKEEGELRLLKRHLSKTLVLAGAIILALSAVIGTEILDKSRNLALLNSKIKAIEPQVEKAKRMKEDIKIIRNEIQKKPLAIDIVAEIYKITPKGIMFNLLDYESDKTLTLRGNAPSLDDVIKFIKVLEESPYFENVKVKYTSKRAVLGKEIMDFEIVCLLSKIE